MNGQNALKNKLKSLIFSLKPVLCECRPNAAKEEFEHFHVYWCLCLFIIIFFILFSFIDHFSHTNSNSMINIHFVLAMFCQ